MKTLGRIGLMLAAGLAISGCASAGINRDASRRRNGAPGSAGSAADAEAAPLPPGADVVEASLRDKDFIPVPELSAIHFDFDQAMLSDDARATLKKNAAWLSSNRGVEVRVAGHCDDRGTSAYNLALGQRRANAVRDYYRMLGVPESRIATISFGKESPLCPATTDACRWSNRRAETFLHRIGSFASHTR